MKGKHCEIKNLKQNNQNNINVQINTGFMLLESPKGQKHH